MKNALCPICERKVPNPHLLINANGLAYLQFEIEKHKEHGYEPTSEPSLSKTRPPEWFVWVEMEEK